MTLLHAISMITTLDVDLLPSYPSFLITPVGTAVHEYNTRVAMRTDNKAAVCATQSTTGMRRSICASSSPGSSPQMEDSLKRFEVVAAGPIATVTAIVIVSLTASHYY